MKEFAIEYILHKLNVKNPKTIYCRIDKFSKLLDIFSYYKKILKNIPAPVDVKKYSNYTDKNKKEYYKNNILKKYDLFDLFY